MEGDTGGRPPPAASVLGPTAPDAAADEAAFAVTASKVGAAMTAPNSLATFAPTARFEPLGNADGPARTSVPDKTVVPPLKPFVPPRNEFPRPVHGQRLAASVNSA